MTTIYNKQQNTNINTTKYIMNNKQYINATTAIKNYFFWAKNLSFTIKTLFRLEDMKS